MLAEQPSKDWVDEDLGARTAEWVQLLVTSNTEVLCVVLLDGVPDPEPGDTEPGPNR